MGIHLNVGHDIDSKKRTRGGQRKTDTAVGTEDVTEDQKVPSIIFSVETSNVKRKMVSQQVIFYFASF